MESRVKSANDRAELPGSFPSRLEIPPIKRDSHLPTAPTANDLFNLRLPNVHREKILDSATPFIDAPPGEGGVGTNGQ